jgi:NTE family protein
MNRIKITGQSKLNWMVRAHSGAPLHMLFLVLLGFVMPLYGAVSPVPNEDAFLLDALWNRYRSVESQDRVKVGVALGGGGARGLAHIGVLKAFEESDVPVDAMTGTSVGALIGALYAAGVSTAKMEQMSQEIGWSSLTNYSRYSLFRLIVTEQKLSSQNMELYLQQHIGNRQFDELKIPFACVATDFQTGERVVFREGSVALAARASSTIPGLFEPVVFRHRFLVDGGLVSNIPTDLLTLMGADIIVGVDVTADFTGSQPKNMLAILNQAIYIQSERMAREELARAQVVIRPKMGDISATDLSRSDECIDAGILAGRRAIPQVKRLILDKRFDQILIARKGRR